MPRITIILCSGVCLLNATEIVAQSLPKNPTQQQVISYRIQQQKMWNAQQLPKNSVLFKSDHRYAAWQSHEFSFKKEKQLEIALPSANQFTTQESAIMNITANKQLPPLLQSHLLQQRIKYSRWKKESLWKDPLQVQGALMLRDFLIQSKGRGNNYQL